MSDRVSRRRLLRWGLGGITGVALPTAVGGAVGVRLAVTATHRSPSVPRFAVPLPIPPVLRPVSTEDGTDRYEVRQLPAEVEILPGRPTPIWGYEGVFPGPTIEARSGRPVAVRHHNHLTVPTVVHLHGGVTPPDSDGYPLDLVLPVGQHRWPGHHVPTGPSGHGGTAGVAHGARTYRYPNQQPAATLWYHDHRMDFTGPQVYRGLAGFYLLRDDAEENLPLPRGERELPLMITDRFFNEDGSFFYPSLDPDLRERPGVHALFADGVRGDTILVNGAPWPFVRVDGARYRLRILNASNARSYDLHLDPPPPGGGGLVQIGSDVGLLPRPVSHDSLYVGAGERYDVIVDFSRYPAGTSVVFGNRSGAGPTAEVLRFDVGTRVADDSAIPERLGPDPEPFDESQAATTRTFRFLGGQGGLPATINLRTFQPDRVDARARLGSTEIWRITVDPEHPFHLHLGHFRVIDRNGSPPDPQDTGWKDTVQIRGGEVRIAVRLTGYPGRYVLHCHNLEHGDMMMMANYEVA
ncbi:multicopper oxidase family protein [Micromonospora polyrhachis]|uniref:Spore coat protein A n=1 Tax=Micromonospora polyrhachis TaxID=1282883 RepID=A0A7W7SP12_9ACTN|nr:multicopper oxidase family protein [Micromonospora polyrhachis]MBB4957090.1 spore coat protein A [Micromonospora polyrhachis]